MSSSRQIITNLLQHAGITIGGPRDWDMIIHNDQCFDMIISNWSLGLGESYMHGMWDCKRLDQFFTKILGVNLDHQAKTGMSFSLAWHVLRYKFLNLQNIQRAFEVGERHYDLGNSFFESMLDPFMQYSCGYWDKAKNLNQAQVNKLDMICQKLHLQPGDRVLEIGCGWGGFAEYAIKHYQIDYTGVSISKEQIQYAKKRLKGLKASFKLQDYRKVTGRFDKIVSIGMFEHVGRKNYRDYFELVNHCLHQDGLFLLHTIGCNQTKLATDPWIHKYIFPNGYIPSNQQITKYAEGLLQLEDWHNFGPYYDLTLMAWYQNFSQHWKQFQKQYPESFFRMWKYYLLCCAGYFRSRKGQLWQIVYRHINSQKPYQSYRP